MLSRSFPLRAALVVTGLAVAACHSKTQQAAPLPTAEVTRGNIAVRVQATGVVEPADTVLVKSKASGMVLQMPVDVGSVVKPGDLLAQVDPRDVRNQYDQAVADDVVSSASLRKALADQAREDTLFMRHVVTAAQHDSSKATTAAAVADIVEKRANLDLALQKLQDATVRAPISGTVISRPITTGQIITSATSANGGTTLMTIADLSRVRMRVTIDEVEMANVRLGEKATVLVDAFPNRTFDGTVEKVEPQAIVDQGVTFFPVLVSISNRDGLLMPGMNGEVTINAGDLTNVVQVPIDAVRPTNELAPVSRMFGVPVDTLTGELRRELTGGEGTTGVPGRYAVVQQSDGSFEMREVKTGPSDLRVAQVVSGLQPGDHVVMLGAIITTRPVSPPKLTIAANLRRDGAVSEATPRSSAKGANNSTANGQVPRQ